MLIDIGVSIFFLVTTVHHSRHLQTRNVQHSNQAIIATKDGKHRAIIDTTIDTSPQGACTQIVYTLGPKYLCRECFKVMVYTMSVHGPLKHACQHHQRCKRWVAAHVAD